MGNENNDNGGVNIGCTGCLFWIVLFVFVFVYNCDGKRFVTDCAEKTREYANIIDSVWHK